MVIVSYFTLEMMPMNYSHYNFLMLANMTATYGTVLHMGKKSARAA